MTIYFIKQAHEAYARGDFSRTAELYEQAILERPELAPIYRQILDRAKAKVGRNGKSVLFPEIRKPGCTYLEDLYQEVELFSSTLPKTSVTSAQPLVSVVMTTYNVAKYIEESVTSLLRQTHSALEIIVVDDCSTDSTFRILQRLSGESSIKIRRLNTNLGTYFAKNVGLKLAKGEFVFFQDGDDLCHPDRIRLCLQELQQPGALCVQSSYSRLLFPVGQVLPVNGFIKKLGLITLGVRRSVFDEIGFFNCTTKASDDELFRRLRVAYRNFPDAIRTLNLPLYYPILRKDSLFADMIGNDPAIDGHIEQRPSPERQLYLDEFQALHKSLPIEQFREVFRFPIMRDPIKVAPGMSKLANPTFPVVASVCSIPERQDIFMRMLASLAPQVDELHIYLDSYENMPDFVRDCHPKVTVRWSKDLPGLRDNGKFVPLLSMRDDCYFFIADDDIEYPPDYVNAMVKKIEHYGRLAVVGVHGVRFPEQPIGYFSGFRQVQSFDRELEQDKLENILGAGTVAFHSACLEGLDYRTFEYSGMAELYLAALCKTRGVPMVAVARPQNWLLDLNASFVGADGEDKNLFTGVSLDDDKQSLLLKKHVPWGYSAIIEAVQTVTLKPEAGEAGERLRALLPILPQCLM